MKLILARHGTAEDAGARPDPDRDLVEKGREEARLMGKVIASTLGIPAAVWSSPLRRASETARLATSAMGASRDIKLVQDLGSGGDLDRLVSLVRRSSEALIMLVGHQPDLGALAARLLGVGGGVDIKKGGFLVLETSDALKPAGRAIATLDPADYQPILEGKRYAPWMGKLRV